MGTAASGGRALSGATTSARLDGGGLWVASLRQVQVATADQVRAWRALAAVLDGGATPVTVEARDARFAPFRDSSVEQAEATNNDDSTLGDGSVYTSQRIQAEVFAAAALRATTLVVNVDIGAALRGGEHFSLYHSTHKYRMYRVGSVTKLDSYTPKVAQVSLDVASPGVVGWAGHGLVANQAVYFTSGGGLPTGLTARTLVYVLGASITTDTFQVSATPGGAAIDFTGSEFGTHWAHAGGHHTLTIRPPLREAVTAGMRAEFDYPKCTMKLMTADAMDLVLNDRFFGQPDVKLIEAFPPFDLS